MHSKGLKIGILVFMLICLLLPFATVSCQGQDVATLNGLKFITGDTIESEEVPVNPFVVISFLVMVGGIAYIVFAKAINNLFLLGGSLIITLMLILFQVTLTNEVTENGFDVSYNVGYWLLLLTSIGYAAFSGYLHKNKEEDVGVKDETSVDNDTLDES